MGRVGSNSHKVRNESQTVKKRCKTHLDICDCCGPPSLALPRERSPPNMLIQDPSDLLDNSVPRVDHNIDIDEIAVVSPGSHTTSATPDQQPFLSKPGFSFGEVEHGGSGLATEIGRQPSFRKSDLDDAASDTRFKSRFRFVRMGCQSILNFAALFIYGLLIFPGLIQVAWRYFFDKRIHRNIPYGEEPRNKLDLYLPENLETPKPVVAFVTGGAWIIGYKAWGSLLALQLLEENVIVACIDYRNFPQGTVSDMIHDVSQGISFICNNISNYGGDVNRLYLIGQSAGAHLGACALMDQLKKQIDAGDVESAIQVPNGNEYLLWKPSHFKAYIGISGGYNLYKLSEHFHSKGMFRSLFFRIMEGEGSLLRYSPELHIQSLSGRNVGSLLPPIYLLHGTDDNSIPHSASTSFVDALRSAGAQATPILYEGKSHTDLFLQDPMRGGHDAVLEDILSIIDGNNNHRPVHRRMVPEVFLKLAHKISPF